jgi:hypothetical protein
MGARGLPAYIGAFDKCHGCVGQSIWIVYYPHHIDIKSICGVIHVSSSRYARCPQIALPVRAVGVVDMVAMYREVLLCDNQSYTHHPLQRIQHDMSIPYIRIDPVYQSVLQHNLCRWNVVAVEHGYRHIYRVDGHGRYNAVFNDRFWFGCSASPYGDGGHGIQVFRHSEHPDLVDRQYGSHCKHARRRVRE